MKSWYAPKKVFHFQFMSRATFTSFFCRSLNCIVIGILDWKQYQGQDRPGVYEAICIDELKGNFHSEYFICFLVVILFIGPKSDHCLILSVIADESFSSLVETWLMWPWRVKMLSSYTLPLHPFGICLICYMDLLKLLHVFLALCQTNQAKVWPRFSIQNCKNLFPTRFSSLTSATVTTSTSIE